MHRGWEGRSDEFVLVVVVVVVAVIVAGVVFCFLFWRRFSCHTVMVRPASTAKIVFFDLGSSVEYHCQSRRGCSAFSRWVHPTTKRLVRVVFREYRFARE